MKVVHVNNSDIRGGAAKAAYSLHNALRVIGVDSKMLVQRKFSKDEVVFSVSDSTLKKQFTNFRMVADLLEMSFFTKKEKGRFSIGNIGTNIASTKILLEADIIHLHWINEGFLSLKNLEQLKKLNKPIVWTFHDMWGFTGGCHYSGSCFRYKEYCGFCPYLKHSSENDFSNGFWKKKKDVYDGMNLTVVTCSKWLASIAKSSSLFSNKKVIPIPNTLNFNVYRPIDKLSSRRKSSLPENKFLILFGTINTKEERKGFSYLKKSLIYLDKMYPNLQTEIELLLFGTSSEDQFKDFPYKINYAGRIIDEERLAECYNAADIFVAPSLEDNLPNTVMEALSCGIPVAAFNIGGIPEMVDHLENGYLAKERSIEDLAEGVYWIQQNQLIHKLKEKSRNKVEQCFTPTIIGNKHLELYKTLLSTKDLF